MMGPAHALSGAAAWPAAGAAAHAAGHPMPWQVLVIGTVVSAGAALAPDLDHRAATISRAFGPLSKAACAVVDRLSLAVYRATRGPGDPRRSGGHRTLTHTAVWAVLCGAATSALAAAAGRWAVLAVLFVHLVLAVEGLLWRQARASSDVLVWLLGAAGTYVASDVLAQDGAGWLFTGPGQEYLWLGLPVTLGALVHCAGDALTVSGCPVLWPLPLGRRRWYPVGPPRALRFRAGARVEVRVLMPLFLACGGVSAVWAAGLLG
ncbi:metal-dependent hydrolase [Streptomyces capparidis]